MAEQQLQDTIIEAIGEAHSKKDVTKLPEFFGDISKDTVTASGFVRRVEVAKKAAGWSDTKAVSHMRLALTGKAEQWFEVMLDRSNPTWEEDLDAVTTAFIMRFEPSAVGARTLASVKDMHQKATDSVQDFADRLMKLAIQWRRACTLPDTIEDNEAKMYARIGMRALAEHILLTLFTCGLKETVKATVMKRCPATFDEALNIALDYEAGMENLKRNGEEPKGVKISPVQESKKTTNFIGKFHGNCHYCGKPGHSQKFCHLRNKRGDPMVKPPNNGNGFRSKNWKTKHNRNQAAVKAEEESEEDEEEEPQPIAAIPKRNRKEFLNFLGVA